MSADEGNGGSLFMPSTDGASSIPAGTPIRVIDVPVTRTETTPVYVAVTPDALGKPGEGIHVHWNGIAIVDLMGTVVGAKLVAKYMGWSPGRTILGALLLGELVHLWLRVPTKVAKLLDPSLR